LLNSEECRRRAEEADELVRKSSDFSARQVYEENSSVCGAICANEMNAEAA
jgi:hypothetical protein